MNSRHGRPGSDRVENVVRAINEIDRIVRNAGYPPDSYRRLVTGEFGEVANENKRVVDQFMSEFRFVVSLGRPEPGGWSRSFITFSDAVRGRSNFNAYTSGTFILSAAFDGFLRLISQCPSCEKWFVIKRNIHKFCSGKCRDKTFRNTAEGKAKRAQYMREYRRGIKRRDVENLRAIQKRKE